MTLVCSMPLPSLSIYRRQSRRRVLLRLKPRCRVCDRRLQDFDFDTPNFAVLLVDDDGLLCIDCEHAEAMKGVK